MPMCHLESAAVMGFTMAGLVSVSGVWRARLQQAELGQPRAGPAVRRQQCRLWRGHARGALQLRRLYAVTKNSLRSKPSPFATRLHASVGPKWITCRCASPVLTCSQLAWSVGFTATTMCACLWALAPRWALVFAYRTGKQELTKWLSVRCYCCPGCSSSTARAGATPT